MVLRLMADTASAELHSARIAPVSIAPRAPTHAQVDPHAYTLVDKQSTLMRVHAVEMESAQS